MTLMVTHLSEPVIVPRQPKKEVTKESKVVPMTQIEAEAIMVSEIAQAEWESDEIEERLDKEFKEKQKH